MEQLIIPVIIGVSEAIKRAGIPSQFIPLVAIVLGAFAYYAIPGLSGGIVDGIVAGLAACGLWSGVKSVSGK